MKYKLDGFSLKLIAIAAMTVDHIAVLFFPEALWMRVIGRLTMPIMAYFVAEGYFHTRSPRHYLYRLLIFAAIAQLPFLFAFGPPTLNVLFTLAAAVALLMTEDSRIPIALKILLSVSILVFSTFCDWALFGVLFVWVFRKYRGNFRLQAIGFSLAAAAELAVLALQFKGLGFLTEAGVLAALPLLSMYNGRRGRDMRYLFYIYYPVHLAILAFLHYLIR